jgi:hypothetical protein
LHIQEDERSSRSKYLLCAGKAIIVGDTLSSKVYRFFTLEDGYDITTRDLIFAQKTSPRLATTLRIISQDPEPDPGLTPHDQEPKDLSTTTFLYSRIVAEDMVLDQDWYRYLLKYLDEAVTFYNDGHPVVRQLFPDSS